MENSLNILVIDNDIAACKQITEELNPYGFDTICCRTAAEGLMIAQSAPVCLIVVAVELSDQNGFVVCGKLKKGYKTQHIPVFITSSASDTTAFDQHVQLNTCADSYFLKPIDMEIFIECVQQHALRPAEDEQDKSEDIPLPDPAQDDMVSYNTDAQASEGDSEVIKALDIDNVDIFGEIDASDVEADVEAMFNDSEPFVLDEGDQTNASVLMDGQLKEDVQAPASVPPSIPSPASVPPSIPSPASAPPLIPSPASVPPSIPAPPPIAARNSRTSLSPISSTLGRPVSLNHAPAADASAPARPSVARSGNFPRSVSRPGISIPGTAKSPSQNGVQAVDPALAEELARIKDELAQTHAALDAARADIIARDVEIAAKDAQNKALMAQIGELSTRCSNAEKQYDNLVADSNSYVERVQYLEENEAARKELIRSIIGQLAPLADE